MAATFEPFDTQFWITYYDIRKVFSERSVLVDGFANSTVWAKELQKFELKAWQCFLKRWINKIFTYVAMSSILVNGGQYFGVLWKHRVTVCIFLKNHREKIKLFPSEIRIVFILTVKLFNMIDVPFRYRHCFWKFVWFILKAHNYFCYGI